MSSLQITKEQARRFLLSYHGLDGLRFPKGKPGIMNYISRVGCIQYDPLNIVGHNQELVLQSRIDGFKPSLLKELLYKDRLLLDGWDKVMSIYSAGDWPYFKRYRMSNLERLGGADKPIIPYLSLIREELRERGPLSSIELEHDQTVSWPWGPTRVSRAALESMWFWGELIIHHKVNTRKYYDFTERNLPRELILAADPNVTFEQYRDWRICRRIGGVGLLWAKTGDAWLEIPETKTPQRQESIKRLTASHMLTEVHVGDINAPLYIRNQDMPLMENVLSSQSESAVSTRKCAPAARILAPLDNLLWDRRLIKELFDFDYRWEVYKPQSKRNYGYYVLPVLYGDRFVARFEPGYDKKSKVLVIKNWWWETGVKPTKSMQLELTKCFRRFTGYLGAEKLLPGINPDNSLTAWLNILSEQVSGC